MKRKPPSKGPTPRKKDSLVKGLSAKKVDKYMRFVLFLAAIGIVYIWNSHYAEKQVSKREKLRKEVKALKDKSFMKEADFNAAIRYSEMASMTDTLGLKKLSKPPFRIQKKETRKDR